MTIATIAANVAAALSGVDTANDAASAVKFDAVVAFAADVAVRLRVEHINKGSNLETDGKGRVVALLDISKEQRAALVTAFTGLSVKEKDAANIASMARTLSLHFIPAMIEDGSLRAAVSGERIAEIIRESVLTITAQAATYNAIEKARSRKWTVAEAEQEEADTDAPMAEMDMSATLDSAPTLDDASKGEDASTAADTLDAEVSNALRVLSAALARDDIERMQAFGLRPFLSAALEAVQKADRENAEAEAALKAA